MMNDRFVAVSTVTWTWSRLRGWLLF